MMRKARNHTTVKLKLPNPCTQTAPNEINTYSDGSLHDPAAPQFSLGGAGVWWPNRQVQLPDEHDHRQHDEQAYAGPIAPSESEIAEVDQRDAGLMLTTFLQGFGGSSTRMELAASILALASDIPVHIGTDSQAFMTKALSIQELIGTGKHMRRPWGTQIDGDLWEIYHNHLKAKGIHALRITKVKGHATQEMVDNKQVKERDKAGNDMADIAAEQGVQMQGQSTVQLGARYAQRQKDYIHLTKHIHDHLLKTYKVRKQLMDEVKEQERQQEERQHRDQQLLRRPQAVPAPKRQRLQPHVRAELPPAEAVAEGKRRQIGFELQTINCGDFRQRHPWAEQLQSFLGRLTFSKASSLRNGCTWLELFILYHLAGYNLHTAQQRPDARTKPTLGHQMKEFRLATRRMVSTMCREVDRQFFRGAPQQVLRLHGCGINTGLAVMPMQLHLRPGVRDHLAAQVLRSQRRLTISEAHKIMREHRHIPLKGIQTRGRTRWMTTLKMWEGGKIFEGEAQHATSIQSTSSTPSSSTTPWTSTTPPTLSSATTTPILSTATSTCAMAINGAAAAAEATRHNGKPNVIYFKCPRCPTATDASRKAFDLAKLDGKTWCKSCSRSLPIKEWRCICGIPWHTCNRHKNEPARIRQVTVHTGSAKPQVLPRRLDNLSHHIDEWLDNQPPKRAKLEERRNQVDLGVHFLVCANPSLVPVINPNMLGPKLKRKFSHLMQEVAK